MKKMLLFEIYGNVVASFETGSIGPHFAEKVCKEIALANNVARCQVSTRFEKKQNSPLRELATFF